MSSWEPDLYKVKGFGDTLYEVTKWNIENFANEVQVMEYKKKPTPKGYPRLMVPRKDLIRQDG